ncbi:MAG: SH3 domain-containing protein [Thermomicrobiales bacterium]|nr:SH3 domain-containing protein [Thermomicrobiales bacterium]
MGTCSHSSHSRTPRWLAKQKLNRRTILQATAAFSATAAFANIPSLRPKASAQGVTTQAQEWVQPDGVGGENGSLGFQSDFAFYAIAPHWPAESDNNTTIEMSTSIDGLVWSNPAVVGPAHTDAGPADKDNRIYGQLAFTDESNYVRYRALDPDGNEQAVPGLTFTYIDATGGPGLDDISTYSPVPSLERPPIISREEWGANLTYGGAERGGSEWLPEYQTVEHVIIHHSETSNFRDPLTEIRSIHYYHAITRGWGDIGYNYLVDFMGNVYEGRVGGDNVVGGHAYQYAYGSSGICVMGSFSVATATPEMLSGLTWITAWAGRYLDPLARSDFHETPNLPTICGHRDVNDSSCPGDSMYADLDYIREAVAEVLVGAKETIPDPDYSPGQVISVTTDSANLRSLPGKSEDILLSAPWGSIFQIIEGPTTVDGESWYHVRGDLGSGWIAQSTFGASNAEAPAGAFAVGDELYVSEDLVNLRDEPSLKGTIVGSVNYMDAATVIDGPMPANGYTWYKVNAADLTGWITERYLGTEESMAKPARLGVVDSVQTIEPDGITLRANPSTNASRLLGLPEGTKGKVIDGPVNAGGYNWIKVQTSLGTGWAAEEFFDLASASVDDAPKFSEGDTVVVDTDYLNLRNEPGATGGVLAKIGTGTTGVVLAGPEIANNMAWYQIETDQGTGWASGQFLALTESGSTARAFTSGEAIYVNTDWVNLRSTASTSADIVDVLLQNANGKVLDGPTSADGYTWYQMQFGDVTGWAAAQYFGKGSADPASTGFIIGAGVTTADGDAVNVRNSASIGSNIVTQIDEGEVATISGGSRDADGYTWIQVSIDDLTGWVARDVVALDGDSPYATGTTVRVFDGELNLRDAASLGGDVVAILPDATHAEVLAGPEESDGYTWYKVSTSRYGTGWAAGTYLTR